MGVKDTANLALIPAAYKTSKVYSALPTDGDGDFTFTRTGSGTRINKAGLIETMGTNVPRLNYRLDADGNPSSCPELLLEPSRQNKVYPNTSITGYSVNNGTATNNQITAPDGTNTGALITKTSSSTTVIYRGFIGTSGVTHNISAFLKAGNHSSVRLQEGFAGANVEIDLTEGSVGSTQNASNVVVQKHPNDWYRISFDFTSASTNLQFSVYMEDTTATGKTFYLWGGQIEQGSGVTSLIPTTTAAITRNKDEAEINNFADAPTDYPFTMYVNMRVETGVKGFGMSFGWDATSNYYYSIGYSEDSGNLRKFRFTNRGSGNAYSYNTTAEYYEGNHKLAVKFLSSTNFIAYINGIEVVNYTHTASAFNSNIQDVLVGQLREVTDTNDRTPIKEAFIFNKALTDAEMVEVTSYTSFTEMATQQQYTIQ